MIALKDVQILGPVQLDDVGDAPPRTLSVLAIVGGVAGLASTFAVWPITDVPAWTSAVSSILLAIFTLVGPGSALLAQFRAVPRPLALSAVPAVGASVVALIATVELSLGLFEPLVTTVSLASCTVVLGVVGLVRVGRATEEAGAQIQGAPASPAVRSQGRSVRGRHRKREPQLLRSASLVLSVTSIVLAAVAFARMAGSEPSDYGPLVRVPELVVAAAGVAIAFACAVRTRSGVAAWLAVFTAVFVGRGATLFATDQAMYEWSYRHLGVMDWFVTNGELVRNVDVYNNWPAALAIGSWFIGSSGMDPLSLSHGFQFGYHLVLVLAVYSLGRCAGLDRFAAVSGTSFVEIVGWVAQDYLSPQAWSYLLAAVVLAALLVSAQARYLPAAITIAGLGFAAIAWAHPLTPVWLFAVVIVLVAIRAVRPWWILALLAALYIPSLVVNFEAVVFNASGFSINALKNSQGNIATPGSAGQQATSVLVRLLSALVWLSAGVAAVLKLRRGAKVLPLVVLALAAFGLLFTSYGGESVYRVFLFSLLGCGLLVGACVSDFLARARALPAVAIALVCAFVLSIHGFLAGYYVLRFSTEDVQMARRIESNAGPTGEVVPIEWAYPLRSTAIYMPQAQDHRLLGAMWDMHDAYIGTDGTDSEPINKFSAVVSTSMVDRPVYVVVAQPMREFTRYFGLLGPEASERIVEHFRSNGWSTVVDEGASGTVVLANPAGVEAWK